VRAQISLDLKPYRELTKQVFDNFVTMLREKYEKLSVVVNGQIGFGDGVNRDNVDLAWISVVAPVTPDTNFTVVHNLNRVPVGYLVVDSDLATNVYRGSLPGTKTTITLRSSVASVNLKLWVF